MTNPTLELLLKRRSAKAALLAAPGPTPAELDTILTCAARVPDHKKLVPWRFIVFEGEPRAKFGELLPRTVAPVPPVAPRVAAYGTCWITEWYSFSETIKKALSLTANERIAGFVYVGTDSAPQEDRERPALVDTVTRWQP